MTAFTTKQTGLFTNNPFSRRNLFSPPNPQPRPSSNSPFKPKTQSIKLITDYPKPSIEEIRNNQIIKFNETQRNHLTNLKNNRHPKEKSEKTEDIIDPSEKIIEFQKSIQQSLKSSIPSLSDDRIQMISYNSLLCFHKWASMLESPNIEQENSMLNYKPSPSDIISLMHIGLNDKAEDNEYEYEYEYD